MKNTFQAADFGFEGRSLPTSVLQKVFFLIDLILLAF